MNVLITLYDAENDDSEIIRYSANTVPSAGESIWIGKKEQSALQMKYHIQRREWILIVLPGETTAMQAKLYVRRLGLLRLEKKEQPSIIAKPVKVVF